MSLLRGSCTWHLYIGAAAISAVMVGRGRQEPEVLASVQEAFPSGDMEGMLEALSRCLSTESELPRRGGRVHCVVSIGLPFVRYVVLPWSTALSDPLARDRIATILSDRQYPSIHGPVRVSYSPLKFGQPVMAALISEQLINNVEALARKHRCTLSDLSPLLARTWNGFYRQLPSTGTLVIAKDGRLIAADHRDGLIVKVSVRPYLENAATPPIPLSGSTNVFCESDAFPALPSENRLVVPNINGVKPGFDYSFALCGAAK